MQKLFGCALFAVVVAAFASPAAAGELTVKIADGKATVIAKDVPVRQILAEWARVGNTRIVNGEKLMGGPISIELVDVPEKDALDILLRSAAGYLTGPRPTGVAGASMYDRVMILATSRPPASTPLNTPPAFNNRPAFNQMPPQPPPPDDDDGEPGDQGPNAPGMMQPGMVPMGQPGNVVAPPGAQAFPGPTRSVPFQGQLPNAADPNNPEGNPTLMPNQPAPPVTSPRPGMLPQPQPQPINPYSPMGRPANRGGDQN